MPFGTTGEDVSCVEELAMAKSTQRATILVGE
jgi:hypothetical protein